jgi:mycofactocin system glycosyltransferase
MSERAAAATLPPVTLRVRLATGVLVRDGGRLLAGGAPFRLTRLSPRGAAVVSGWRGAGAPIGDAAGAAALARRLLDAGLLDAVPGPAPAPALRDVGVVVPVHDRADQLDRCLTAIGATAPGIDITVVDDGSRDAAAIAAVARAHGAAIVRRAVNGGPAAARNAGLAHSDHALVAFVDSDVVVGPDPAWLRRLVAHFDDPRVGAVAPRVVALDAPRGPLAGYETRHSSLDMGARGGLAAPGRPTSYVPSTTVVVRRAAVPGAGFDTALRIGEDVDFVWRMAAAGWLVRYEPAATVRHAHRLAPGPFVARRRQYAMSIAPLSRRHPEALAAFRGHPATTAAAVLLAARRPGAALALLALRAAGLHREIGDRTTHPIRLAARLTALDAAGTAHGLSHALRRTWSPLLLVLAIRRPRTLLLLAAAEAIHLLDRDAPCHPTDIVLAATDDLIAAAGTWEGCARHRTLRPLLPGVATRQRPQDQRC